MERLTYTITEAAQLLGISRRNNAAAPDWERRLAHLERYRHYVRGYTRGHDPAPGGTPLDQALGPPPTDPVGHVMWKHAAADLAPTPPARALER
jgi:hypothetical protein